MKSEFVEFFNNSWSRCKVHCRGALALHVGLVSAFGCTEDACETRFVMVRVRRRPHPGPVRSMLLDRRYEANSRSPGASSNPIAETGTTVRQCGPRMKTNIADLDSLWVVVATGLKGQDVWDKVVIQVRSASVVHENLRKKCRRCVVTH